MEDVDFLFPNEEAERIASFLVESVSEYQEEKKKVYQG